MSSVFLDKTFSYPDDLVEQAVAFPTGRYVELDDATFGANGMGRKIVQTHLVQLGGREVSVGYLNEDETGYELIRDSDHPRDLGSFEMIVRGNQALFSALQRAFGGTIARYSHFEMVAGINKALADGVSPKDELRIRGIATWSRTYTKRASWIIRHRLDAILQSPVDWKAVGL